MGGVQSSAHSLGDALWVHERQRQRGQREASGRYESQDGQSETQDRRRLLKRTRSLAVISEDCAKNERRETRQFHLGEPDLELPRRPQLIPRAKLIDRNSLKDRLSKSQQHLSDSYDRFNESRSYHSHSTCELYSVPPALASLPDPPLYGRTSRADPDRLNILDWPRTPRRYRSHQDLDTVSGLVEIVEDDWPIDDHRSVDSVHTQVKRKRKEHRSLDSILQEDDNELEYFDVLNLLPLSKVRLEFNESDARSSSCSHSNNLETNRGSNLGNFGSSNNSSSIDHRREFVDREVLTEEVTSSEAEANDDDEDDEERREDELTENSEVSRPEEIEISKISRDNGNNYTDEEKCKREENKSYPEIVEFHERRYERDSWRSFASFSPENDASRKTIVPSETLVSSEANWPLKRVNIGEDEDSLKLERPSSTETESAATSIKDFLEEPLLIEKESTCETSDPLREIPLKNSTQVEEAEDYKSIWISDSEETEDMSRRPQVLKIIDSEVTAKRKPQNVVNGVAREKLGNNRDFVKIEKNPRQRAYSPIIKNESANIKEDNEMSPVIETKTDVESARNFFESKSLGKGITRNERNEGRFERIVKETSNILGKACNVVRGSLGFEARSESSDLGLGSDCGSDTRRRSIDEDAVDEIIVQGDEKLSANQITEEGDELVADRKSRTSLTRSRSCVDSMESQESATPEFDHVRYKIVKSRLFGKNMYGNAVNKGDVTYDGLMEYLREYSFQELLLDNNVVIIEPVRAETIDRKSSSAGTKDRASITKIPGNDQKKANDIDNGIENKAGENENSLKSSKQSSLRKHFFYHPIRVNKELIDEELPDPDTVKNVRRMFENSLRGKSAPKKSEGSDCKSRKSVSMKDLRRIDESPLDDESAFQASSRSRCSSRAKDLTRLFEALEKSPSGNSSSKTEENPKPETKARIIAQSFEARSGNTSPSEAGSTTEKLARYHRNSGQRGIRRQMQNWDAGSVSSGVSSDYPDTDQGSGAQCTSSEDEEADPRDEYESRESDRVSGHFVSQDVLRKIRECGTSVTYYGGKVVNTCNGPLVSPMSCKLGKERSLLGHEDYVKFRLVKSNSCDSRLELTGRVIERKSYLESRGDKTNPRNDNKSTNLRESTIAETPSIEITSIENRIEIEERKAEGEMNESKREPPIVIGLEPKKDDGKETSGFKADFKLGKIDDARYANRFGSALTRWQVNEANWKKTNADFGKMEFEEFEVLEDSLNGN